MEALGVATSIIAVVELSAKIALLCLQYSKDVKHAKNDIIRLRVQVTHLESTLKSTQKLLEGPNSTELKSFQHLLTAVNDSQLQLQRLYNSLRPRKARQVFSRLGIRSLKWPFQNKDFEKIIQDLGQCIQTIVLALQVDQT